MKRLLKSYSGNAAQNGEKQLGSVSLGRKTEMVKTKFLNYSFPELWSEDSCSKYTHLLIIRL